MLRSTSTVTRTTTRTATALCSCTARLIGALTVFACAVSCATLHAEDKKPAPAPAPTAKPDLPPNADKPISADGGEIGKLLTQWWKEGTAAGNVGDRYDNRDRTHSMLNMKPYPQLTLVPYTENERKGRLDWAAQRRLLPGVVFGNSSTSAPAAGGGSNIRRYYVNPQGMKFLYTQYRKNQLYMYPEHRDHDPGHNGTGGGYGDLYPVNSPYLLASQGSSGSDQPFMKAVPFTLAAFRPDVKKKLADAGLLMPTLQMIFRRSNKHIQSDEEYFSGKAHPTVFEGSWVDAPAMVKRAHDITLENLPPLVQLKVLKEDAAVRFVDYIDPHPNEHLADTPCVIGRIWRGRAGTRRMSVSAADSVDLNKKPLSYRWEILRGDPQRISIKPNAAGDEAEITVTYHPRRPSAGPGSIESNRVDIGVFAHNGVHPSAPAFITFFTLDHEARTYADDGRIVDIGYQNGTTDLSVKDWDAFFDCLKDDAKHPFAGLLRDGFTPEQRTALLAEVPKRGPKAEKLAAAKDLLKTAEAERNKARKTEGQANKARDAAAKAHKDQPGEDTKAALDKAQADAKAASKARKALEKPVKEAKKSVDAAQKEADAVFNARIDALNGSVKTTVEKALHTWRTDPLLYQNHRRAIDAHFAKNSQAQKKWLAARTQLATFGLMDIGEDAWSWTPARKDDKQASIAERLTKLEQLLVARANQTLLAEALFPTILSGQFKLNYVDPLLSLRKSWRDVYRHDAKGRVIGWTRYAPQGQGEFHADGWLIVERDAQGRAAKTQAVEYDQPPPANKQRPYPNFNAVIWKTKPSFRTYAYQGDDDRVGVATEVPEVKNAPQPKANGKGEGNSENGAGAQKKQDADNGTDK